MLRAQVGIFYIFRAIRCFNIGKSFSRPDPGKKLVPDPESIAVLKIFPLFYDALIRNCCLFSFFDGP